MGRIDYGRVLLGGLLAGLVINVSEFLLNGVILGDTYEAIMATSGLSEASWAMAGYVIAAFVLGIAVAWLYAAIRPRFGPGWKTAAIAGVALWVMAYLVPSVWFGAMGLSLGVGATMLTMVWGVIELALAGVAAGWVYREGPATATASAHSATEPTAGPPPM